jgi:protein-S-isoprenylcysteine O-methyltransferase Ste14
MAEADAHRTRREEARLAAQFGDAYSAYRSATRRWF